MIVTTLSITLLLGCLLLYPALGFVPSRTAASFSTADVSRTRGTIFGRNDNDYEEGVTGGDGSAEVVVAAESTTTARTTLSRTTSVAGSSSATTKARWITCSSTKELVKAVKTFVKPNDVVAELGSQLREVSTAICESCAEVTLVDVKRKFPNQSKQRPQQQEQQQQLRTKAMRRQGDDDGLRPNDSFLEIQTLSDWRNPFFFASSSSSSTQKTYDVLVLDVQAIVGNDLGYTSLSIAKEFLALNEAFAGQQQQQQQQQQQLSDSDNNNNNNNDVRSCRLVLVKSAQLNRLGMRLYHGQQWIDRGPSLSSVTPYIVATVGVQEYRNTIARAVQPGDAVLEVGCHLGTTTAMLYDKAKQEKGKEELQGSTVVALGVDIGASIVDGARQRYPHIPFAVGDAWKTAELLRFQREKQQEQLQGQGEESANKESHTRKQKRTVGFDVVYVDVGGLSGSDGLLEALNLLSSLEHALEPRCLVIKSLCMRRLSTTITPFWQAMNNNNNMMQSDSSKHANGEV